MEIRELKNWKPGVSRGSGAQVLDMFSGCGGMSLGFSSLEQIEGSFTLLGGVDINQTSLNTYSLNFGVPGTQADVRDLAASPSDLRALLHRLPKYDSKKPLVLIGCAPCQGFSAHRKKNWNTSDDRNDLVGAFAQIAVTLQPECIVMENVPELLSGRYWHYFEKFRDLLTPSGYVIKQSIHNAAEFGTPQERFRALVVATKSPGYVMPKALLQPSEFRTVRDAIGNLPSLAAGAQSSSDTFHRSAKHRNSTINVIRSVPKDGGSRPAGVGPACLDRTKGFSDVYGRLSWDKPSITITHYARNPASGRFTHPQQNRGLTMREAARLQGFPDSFTFTGGFDDVFRQIGEAVPPTFSLAVARSIGEYLSGEVRQADEEDLVMSPVNDSFAGVIAGLKMRRE